MGEQFVCDLADHVARKCSQALYDAIALSDDTAESKKIAILTLAKMIGVVAGCCAALKGEGLSKEKIRYWSLSVIELAREIVSDEGDAVAARHEASIPEPRP